MGNLNSQQKAKMSSTNPFDKFCGDLHELMLQHFDGYEVLDASEVSPEWNEVISTSPKRMTQLPLKCNWWWIPEEISESSRQYNDLRIELKDYDTVQFIQQNLFQLLEKFAPFLKKLEIATTSKIDFAPQNLHLPKLESLGINSKFPIVFKNATKLKKLSLRVDNFNRTMVDWIESQTQLEELNLNAFGKKFFDFDPKAPKGVKRFYCWLLKGLTETDAEKFNNFIEPMCDTLTFLQLCGVIFPVNFELIVNEMSKLKTFKLNYYVENLNGAKLKSNKNITELQISEFSSGIQYLLLSLVNLDDLEIVVGIDVADIEWIARNLMKLKKLSSRYFETSPETIVQRYNEMRATEQGINMDIELS
jgi:hypothetical protein